VPTAAVTSNFAGQALALAQVVTTQAQGILQQGRRTWAYPALNGWAGNPFDIPGIKTAYDRTDANNQYVQATQTAQQPDGGRLADRLAAKLQVDFLAAQERAFRARQASAVRCTILAAARRQGQGQSSGVYLILPDYVADIIAEGYSGPKQP
jgi:hypothetical protein